MQERELHDSIDTHDQIRQNAESGRGDASALDDAQSQRETLKRVQAALPESAPAPDMLTITAQDAEDAVRGLLPLDYGEEGLTRDEIRDRYPALPLGIYLRLPASRRFTSARDTLHAASLAPSRAEGEYLGENPDIPDAASVADGGPPAWGPTPLDAVDGVEDSGSAEDRDILQPE